MAVLVSLLVIITMGSSLVSGMDCPSKCLCKKDLTSVNCEGKGLTSIPEDIPPTVTHLYLDHNTIDTITSNALSRLSNLRSLYLRSNVIRKIEPFAFSGTASLDEIYLTNNRLESFDEKSFQNAKTVTFLNLAANRFKSIPPLGHLTNLNTLVLEANRLTNFTFPEGFSNLDSLYSITLSNNDVKKLSGDEFIHLNNSGVRSLLLSRSNIEEISDQTFLPLTSLKTLKIAQNPLDAEQLKNAVISLRNSPLQSINIANLKLGGRLPSSTFELFRDREITVLLMNNNEITSVPDRAFAGMPQLMQLEISACAIREISHTAFEDLKDLRILKMNDNQIKDIPYNLPHRLTNLYLNGNRIEAIYGEIFANLTGLEDLNLSMNHILTLAQDAFFGLANLRKLHLASNRIASLPAKVFRSLGNLQTLDLSKNNLARIVRTRGLFSYMFNLKNLDLSNNNCSFLPPDIFSSLQSLENLKLQRNRLGKVMGEDGSILFGNLSKLQKMDMSYNDIQTLGCGIFNGSSSLLRLDISGNKLTELNHDLFSTDNKLQGLIASSNLISVVTEPLLTTLKDLQVLDIAGNPFYCWCDLIWFREWMKTTDISIPKLETYTCNDPASWKGKQLLQFDKSDMPILSCIGTWVIVLVASLVGVLISAVILSILYRKRWIIWLNIYRLKKTLKRRYHGESESTNITTGAGSKFDAYVSYCEGDKAWVRDSLLPDIDSGKGNYGKFQLCFEARDMHPGQRTIGFIEEGLTNSKRVLIVLSREYAESNRHQFELEQIIHAKHGDPPVILDYLIIKTAHIEPKHIPKLLAAKMENLDFVEWADNPHAITMFKNKLRDYLTSDKKTD